jgi:hypothetical protein
VVVALVAAATPAAATASPQPAAAGKPSLV